MLREFFIWLLFPDGLPQSDGYDLSPLPLLPSSTVVTVPPAPSTPFLEGTYVGNNAESYAIQRLFELPFQPRKVTLAYVTEPGMFINGFVSFLEDSPPAPVGYGVKLTPSISLLGFSVENPGLDGWNLAGRTYYFRAEA